MGKKTEHECGNRDCEINLLTQISKKLSIKAFFIVLTCSAIPVAAWGWAISTKHEARLCVIEQKMTGILEMSEDIKAIKKVIVE